MWVTHAPAADFRDKYRKIEAHKTQDTTLVGDSVVDAYDII